MWWVVRPLYPRERLGTHCIGGWVGTRAYMEVCGMSRRSPGFDLWTFQAVGSLYTD